MALQAGRFACEVAQTNVATLDETGNDVKITGRISASGSDAVQLREQLINLKNNPFEDVIPVVYDEYPWVNGYYFVTDASVNMGTGALEIGYFEFTLGLTRVPKFAAPLIEILSVGSVRPNGIGITNCVGWVAVPDSAMGVNGATAMDLRLTEGGAVRVYNSGNNGLLDDFVTFACPPNNWYDGAATIRTGDVDSVDVQTFIHTGGTQSYVVPAGVTKIQVDLRGAQGGGKHGGKGGRMRCILNVTPGETLHVNVGGRGRLPTTTAPAPNGSEGWNGGGTGNQGAISDPVKGYGSNGDGFGGGGATDVRQGGTALANRAVIAGAGAGEGGHDPTNSEGFAGGAGGINGGPGKNPGPAKGLGATQTAGGPGGTHYPSAVNDGSDGALGVGGAGANAHTTGYYGAGGGGGGYYGGGGGAEGPIGFPAGSGGGGSSLSTGQATLAASGYNEGNGLAILVPVTDDTEFNRFVVVGDQVIDSPFGWELSNGLIKVQPVYTGDHVAFQLRCWNGTEWSNPREWFYADDGNTTMVPTTLRLVSCSILRNAPEEVAIRLDAEYNDKLLATTITITLRRGSPIANFRFECPTAKNHAIWTVLSWASSGLTGNGIVQNTLSGDGVGILAACAFFSTRVNSGQNGFYLGAGNLSTKCEFGLGFDATQFAPTGQSLVNQWYAAQSESVRAVVR